MKVNELSNSLNIKNKDLIDFLKSKGYAVKSHMQAVTDEMIDVATAHFTTVKEEKVEELNETIDEVEEIKKETVEKKTEKVFKPDDIIPCKCVVPYQVIALGVDKNTIYNWNYYGDIEYVTYRDLQSWRRTDYITKPLIIIEDADLCYNWRRELGETYKYFLGVEYPEEFFDLPDSKFIKYLTTAPDVIKDLIKTTAYSMIRNENYPSVQKLNLIDEYLGTCLRELL